MKNKRLLLAALIFFLTTSTVHYWEGKLGLFALPAFLILAVVYLALVIALIRQIYLGVKEKFSDKARLLTIGLLTTALTLTFLISFGLINVNFLEGETVLVAEREGNANCMTTLKLKDDFTFSELNVCFGITETKGDYHFQNDTIYFDHVSIARNENAFFEFAVIEPTAFYTEEKQFNLIRYKNRKDTLGSALRITKNELYNLKNKKPNR